MPRTAAVLSMSLDDLQRVIRDRQRALAKLERQRAKVQRKLDVVERQIAAVTGSSSGGRRGRPSGRPRNDGSLSEAIARVLAGAGGPMKIRDIAEKVQAGGYRSSSANFRGVVNQALFKDKRFKSAGRGLYQMDGMDGAAHARAGRRGKTRRQGNRKKGS